MTGSRTITVESSEAGQRLDRYLRKVFRSVPLSAIYKWIRIRKVKVNGAAVERDYRLHPADVLTLYISQEDYDLRHILTETQISGPLPPVLYEDPSLLVLDKPFGLAVHGGTKISSDHLTFRVRSYLQSVTGDRVRSYDPAPVHRLDRETSGIIVYAKDLISHRKLCRDLKQHRWQKRYLCLVFGKLARSRGTFEWSLVSKIRDRSKPKLHAETHFQVIDQKDQAHLLEVVPITGRFRQIRRHLALAGLALFGETKYGDPTWCSQNKKQKNRLFLHAHSLEMDHPVSGEKMNITAALPFILQKILKQVGLPPIC